MIRYVIKRPTSESGPADGKNPARRSRHLDQQSFEDVSNSVPKNARVFPPARKATGRSLT